MREDGGETVYWPSLNLIPSTYYMCLTANLRSTNFVVAYNGVIEFKADAIFVVAKWIMPGLDVAIVTAEFCDTLEDRLRKNSLNLTKFGMYDFITSHLSVFSLLYHRKKFNKTLAVSSSIFLNFVKIRK
mgnify:CR=1 FL=1